MKTMRLQNCLRVLGGKKQANKVWYGKCLNGESAIVDGASDNLNWENIQATLEIIITGTV